MKKNIVFLICILAFILLITGCSKKGTNYKLQIKESSWSGWTQNYKPKEVVNKYNVTLGKEYNIDSGILIFKITKINNDSIIIETKDSFSDNENGVDLQSKKKKFKVSINKELTLTTSI